MVWLRCSSLCLLLGLVGCSNYVTPGGGAKMYHFTGGQYNEQGIKLDADIDEILQRKPVAEFPAHFMVARVQAPGYQSYSGKGYGRGNYSVLTVRDIEAEEDFLRLRQLPQVAGVAPLNRLLLPSELKSDKQLRQAAAALHADVILLYTIETEFVKEDTATPVSVITLGLSPTINTYVYTTASGLLLDAKTGYVYAAVEQTAKEQKRAAAWTDRDAIDQSRRITERKAFVGLLDEFTKAWPSVVMEYKS